MRFTKMHGLGNDFVVFDGVRQSITLTPALIRHIADRHYGIGCDQVLLVEAIDPAVADFRYRIFNADGGEVEQCGNGARCFARFVCDQGLFVGNTVRVMTRAGLLALRLQTDGHVAVDMGIPRLEPADIPFRAPARAQQYMLMADDTEIHLAAVSMGNPHAILRVADVDHAPVATQGPLLEVHPRFPCRTNVEFMQVIAPDRIRLRVYERGVGETLACGTGACAAVVAGHLQGVLATTVKVSMPGGDLTVYWAGEGESVILTGPAVAVFEGEIHW